VLEAEFYVIYNSDQKGIADSKREQEHSRPLEAACTGNSG